MNISHGDRILQFPGKRQTLLEVGLRLGIILEAEVIDSKVVIIGCDIVAADLGIRDCQRALVVFDRLGEIGRAGADTAVNAGDCRKRVRHPLFFAIRFENIVGIDQKRQRIGCTPEFPRQVCPAEIDFCGTHGQAVFLRERRSFVIKNTGVGVTPLIHFDRRLGGGEFAQRLPVAEFTCQRRPTFGIDF